MISHQAMNIRLEDAWKPFRVEPRAERMRALTSPEGVGDRLRAVAFAEIQARDGFLWGIQNFPDAPEEWRLAWAAFAKMEEEHAQLLLDRAAELGVDIGARAVSDTLMRMFLRSESSELFLYQIATAEERGMDIGLSMLEPMRLVDAGSAAVFARIAEEEVDHVATAKRFLEPFSLDFLKDRAQFLAAASQSY
jgi:uncharacterized ferritin-like protein (DUF455 family)